MAIQEDPPAGVPEWVVTYGDMMSLLLTFFIMLVSMSEMKTDDGKYRAMMDALEQVFGPNFGRYSAPGDSFPTSSMFSKLASLGVSADGGMEKSNRKAKGAGGPNDTVKRIRDGKVVTLGGPAVFERFSAEIGPQLEKDLELLLVVFADKTNRVEVRGHATPEPLPPDSPYKDAMDLSFARAHAVAKFLMARGIPRERIRVSAAGDSEPRNLVRGADAQSVNRRVDLFLVDSYTTRGQEGEKRPN